MYFLLKMGIFHCYVSLPEGSSLHYLLTGFITSKRWENSPESRHIPDAVRCLASEMAERPEAKNPVPQVGSEENAWELHHFFLHMY